MKKQSVKLDILAFSAHPDDVELSCSGTLMKHIEMGKKVGVVDLTLGQLGSRGSSELRLIEAQKASEILGISIRDNLGMEDGYFVNDAAHRLRIIEKIRQYQPDVVLCNVPEDRHPDHGRASELVAEACFYSGLTKIETQVEGEQQKSWRPNAVYHYIQDYYHEPDFVVDISDYFDRKMESIYAFSSQFYNPDTPDSNEPETPISGKEFMENIKGRAAQFGRTIGKSYGEGFLKRRSLGIKDITDLI